MKISVIIPVYNVEPYLRECLDSVREQTFRDWECICVDDGSTDGSVAILEEYVLADPRFRVIRHPHSNAGAARNVGLDASSGEFLAFLDSDDVFSPWMLEFLVNGARDTGAEVVACGYSAFVDGRTWPSFCKPQIIRWVDISPDPDWSKSPMTAGVMPWCKIIKRDVFKRAGVKFQEQASTNDLGCMVVVLASSGKTVVSDERMVGYRQHRHSIQAGKDPVFFISACRFVMGGLKASGVWDSLSERGKVEFYRFFARIAIWELRSQSSRKRHSQLVVGIRELDAEWGGVAKRLRVTDGTSGGESDLSSARCCSIVENHFKERLHSFFEGVLSPLLGNRTRLSGFRGRIATLLHRALVSAFESTKWPWN